jgi:aromatic-L-amino-acid decarboxylase
MQAETYNPPSGDMPAEEFRRYGHQLIDWLSDWQAQMEMRPVLPDMRPGDLIAQLPATPPVESEPMDAILADMERLVAPALTQWHHPSFFAYFATSTSLPGVLAEMLSAAFDQKAMLWRTSPASTELEQVTLDWLRQMMGLDAGYTGIIYDTASVGTMHAIAAAREGAGLRIREEGMSGRPDLPLLRVYCSEQAHSSVDKAVITLGLGQRGLRKIPTDEKFQMRPDALAAAIAEDKANGFAPIVIVATVGTTSTTSVDSVADLAPICEEHAMWLHVDAAYAGSAAVVPEFQHYFRGCERADSIVTNPHKWLFTPFDLSVLYCRHMDLLKKAFVLTPEYLKTPEEETVRHGSDYGIQLGRRFRALKLWFVLRYFGHEGLAARIREHCRLARLFASWVEASGDWEILAPAPFSVVCFRHRSSDAENERIMHTVNATGRAFLSHTKLNNVFTLRLAVGNIHTTQAHVEAVWELLREAARAVKTEL